jgi:glycosyltransferase involved in cell wall biosynthesis
MSRRVLFIAYLFPPIANSGTQRPLKFAKYLPQFGWDPLVVTAQRVSEHRQDPRLLEDVPLDTRVVRVPMLNDRIGAVASTLGLGMMKPETIAEGISWRLRNHWQSPDLYALWRPTARRAAMKLYREVGFDAIYATGFPWTSLLTGMDVSKLTGRPLVADFRDLWASEDLFKSDDLDRDQVMEAQVVDHAAAILSISSKMTERMIAAHPTANPAKFYTIPNGYDPSDMGKTEPWPHKRFRIVYTGVWKKGYGLDTLYDAIEQVAKTDPALLSNVEVMAAGFEPGPAHERGLSDYVDELGVLSHDDAVALMRSADVLYLRNFDGIRQDWCLPGKIFEYLATGRPLLAVTQPDGEAGRLISRIGGGVVVDPSDTDGLRRILTNAFRRGVLETSPQDPVLLRAFERPALTRLLASVFDTVTRQSAVA